MIINIKDINDNYNSIINELFISRASFSCHKTVRSLHLFSTKFAL